MGVGVDGLVLGFALVHELLDQPVREVDLEGRRTANCWPSGA
jgi:hypothetical protein